MNNNNNPTFLTHDQIVGDTKLEVLQKYGNTCSVTDFSILLGEVVSDNYYTNDGVGLKNRAGWWWTKEFYVDTVNAMCVSPLGRYTDGYYAKRNYGGRPVFSYSTISQYSIIQSKNQHGILEIEFGEYPQSIVDFQLAKKLDSEYKNKTLKESGKYFTVDYEIEGNQWTCAQTAEYVYKGEKYIRFVADAKSSGKILSNGLKIIKGETYWIKVEPIVWLIDEKANVALSKKILFSGIQYKHPESGWDSFDKTTIKKFMDDCFVNEIMDSETYSKIMSQSTSNRVKRNIYKFNFNEVTEEDIIRGSIESGISVFLHGASSEGKSARVKQIDPDCEIIYLRNASPESLNGKSVYDASTGKMIDIEPTWLLNVQEKCSKEPEKLHIIFFDEITNALPSIQGIAFNIVLDREVNGKWKLPDNARIVAAGNDMKDSLSANQLAEPLFNRFAHVYIKTTVESWLKWASENNIHPSIYSYIAYKREKGLRSPYDGEKPNADPRKWEMASKVLYKTKNPQMLRGLVGEEITNEFVAFCNQSVITLEDVLNDNYTEEQIKKLNTAERYATVTTLSQVNEDNLEKVRNFVIKIGPEFISIFDLLWTHGDEDRLEKIAEFNIENEENKLNI